MIKTRNVGLTAVLALNLVSVSFYTSAKEFITIIGPDGRPLVVPRNNAEKKTEDKSRLLKKVEAAIVQPVTVRQNIEKLPVVENRQVKLKHDHNMVVQPVQLHTAQEKIQSKPQLKPESQAIQNPDAGTESSVATIHKPGFSQVEGIKYVDSEYLENKEFNLEGKKRFYSMPEGVVDKNIGTTRIQTIEREKGVGQSVLKSLFQTPEVDPGPVVLAQSYYRISQPETIDSLGKQCFNDKKIKKAKEISLKKAVNLWPRAPLKADEFDFEVVKLQSDIQNIQINSYASSQKNPTYYWPFVVFLDSRGCVLEGAGGYKNQEEQANIIQHERIEGVLQIPAQSGYILLTPLASAIDVEDKMLTNHGQLKLVAIR
ncbi:putative pilus assembly protein FilE [Acinetobacter lwoffii]|uniref:putative pilus assembly protein FilE n=1 Tax=Acinetobacter lwoffii TaxID=28090 RepID=UPI00209A7013|nr:putative pilus assembly protein FilE [Acinetobacter lwoffii]MCO8062264.1 putative pilus assembly protein FilE [Acinetobacter lwoffii]